MDDLIKLLPVIAFLGQAGLVFFFLGKMKGALDGSAALFVAYEKHQDRMLSEYKQSTATAIAELNAAVHGLDNGNERASTDRATLREEIAAFRATTEAEGRFTREAVDSIRRDVHQLQRQMSNVAAGTRAKITEIGGPKV